MIVNQQQVQFQPVVITIETLIELEALRIAVGSISYDIIAARSLTPALHDNAIGFLHEQLNNLR
jgi:hypothetical protein